MNTLHVAIKQQYLDLIKTGAKTTEYRDMTAYWVGKLCEVPAGKTADQHRSDILTGKATPRFKPYTHITFHCGPDSLTLPITTIRTYRTRPYFAIGLSQQ